MPFDKPFYSFKVNLKSTAVRHSRFDIRIKNFPFLLRNLVGLVCFSSPGLHSGGNAIWNVLLQQIKLQEQEGSVCMCVWLGRGWGVSAPFQGNRNSLPQGVGSGYHGNKLAYRQERKKGWGLGCDVKEVEGIFIYFKIQRTCNITVSVCTRV